MRRAPPPKRSSNLYGAGPALFRRNSRSAPSLREWMTRRRRFRICTEEVDLNRTVPFQLKLRKVNGVIFFRCSSENRNVHFIKWEFYWYIYMFFRLITISHTDLHIFTPRSSSCSFWNIRNIVRFHFMRLAIVLNICTSVFGNPYGSHPTRCEQNSVELWRLNTNAQKLSIKRH